MRKQLQCPSTDEWINQCDISFQWDMILPTDILQGCKNNSVRKPFQQMVPEQFNFQSQKFESQPEPPILYKN